MRAETVLLPTAALILALCGTASAKPANVPSHCRSGEFAYLNAKMSRVVKKPDGGYSLVPAGTVLSLCADRKEEPFHSLAYRYGPVGHVALERVASTKDPFNIFTRSTSPHTGENLIFFSAGGYNYYVTEAIGQGSGVGLSVFKSGRKVVDLFSGNKRDVEFEAELLDINFDTAASRIFEIAEPNKDP